MAMSTSSYGRAMPLSKAQRESVILILVGADSKQFLLLSELVQTRVTRRAAVGLAAQPLVNAKRFTKRRRSSRHSPRKTPAVQRCLASRRVVDAGSRDVSLVESTVTRDGKTSTERRSYLSSATWDATAFAAAVRAPWRIQNCLHWVLDAGFDEDRARNRKDHGPENLTTLWELALNALRTARPEILIRRKRKRSGFARSGLGQMRLPRPRTIPLPIICVACDLCRLLGVLGSNRELRKEPEPLVGLRRPQGGPGSVGGMATHSIRPLTASTVVCSSSGSLAGSANQSRPSACCTGRFAFSVNSQSPPRSVIRRAVSL